MNAIEKNKNRFIVNLESGKQTYFDFADGKIYGASGKPVGNFSSAAKKILKENSSNDFIAKFLIERAVKNPCFSTLHDWDLGMVETIYSLYNEKYCVNILLAVGDFCHEKAYVLNSQNVKLLTEALSTLATQRPYYISRADIYQAILEAKYQDYPEAIKNLLPYISADFQDIIFAKDIKKIMFHLDHEAWNLAVGSSIALADYLERYIRLCDLLGKERNYKNLFLSIGQMEKEKMLIRNKLCCDWQPKDKLFYENDKFTVVVPTTAEEFQTEGDNQQNCVFRQYYPEVVDHKTHIVFIRKKKEPNKSYITCEVSNSGQIIQYLCRFNHHVTDEQALNFKANYEQFLANRFRD